MHRQIKRDAGMKWSETRRGREREEANGGKRALEPLEAIFFFQERAHTHSAAGETVDRRKRRRRTQAKRIKLFCIDLKYGARKYMCCILIKVLDLSGKEEKYPRGAGAHMDFGEVPAL